MSNNNYIQEFDKELRRKLHANIIVTKEQAKLLDTLAITKNNIPPAVLMEEAGEKIVNQLQKDFPKLSNEKIAIVAGWGNNGGDALVLARKLFFLKINFDLFIFDKSPSQLNLLQLDILKSLGIKILPLDNFINDKKDYTIIIDAIFGIGFSYRKDTLIETIFNTINTHKAKVISIDIPSGLTTENTPSIRADYTYSIGFIKKIFFSHTTRSRVGKLINLNISFDISNIKYDQTFYINNFDSYQVKESNYLHKYSRGGVVCIGGSLGMYGSILFSAKSALNTGCGIALVLTDEENIKSLNTIMPELIYDSIKNFQKYSNKYNTIVIGPGLFNTKQENIIKINQIIKENKQFILDASFFSLFDKSILSRFTRPPILTPHAGEYERFFGRKSPSNKNNTITAIRETAVEYNCYILYKDSFMLFATPDKKVYIFDNPNYISAQAGSGDILTGLIAGILSQNNPVEESIYYSISIFYTICNRFSNKKQLSYSTKEFIELIGKVEDIQK